MIVKIQVRRGLSTQWTSVNPILSSGEFGYETDTGKLKIGDGTTAWVDLGYLQAEGLELTSPITGYEVGSNTPLSDTDSILSAFGKAQGQINARISGSIDTTHIPFSNGLNSIIGDTRFTFSAGSFTAQIIKTTVNNGSASIQLQNEIPANNLFIVNYSTLSPASLFGLSRNNACGVFTTGNSRFFLGATSNIPIYFGTNNLPRLTILATGEAGFNTTSPTNTVDVNGTLRIRTVANASGNFATYSATGVMQQRTALESANDILKSISGYSAGVNQRLEHNSSGVLNWVNT